MRIVPRHERAEARAADLEKVIRIIDGTPDTPASKSAGKQIGFRSGEGDRQRMRAIPVIAEGILGTAPGTDPYEELDDNWPLPTADRSGTLLAKQQGP